MRARTTAVLILVALAAFAEHSAAAESKLREVFSEKASKTLPLGKGGAVFIESFAGSITVTAGEDDKIVVQAKSTIKAEPGVDVRQIRDALGIQFEGNASRQTIKSIGVLNRRQVVSLIDYDIKVPASASVNIIGGIGESFRVEGVSGRVFVRNLSGTIAIDRVTGPIVVESVKADVIVTHRKPPTSGCDITSTNGNIEIHVPEKSKLRWLAQTLKGDILTGRMASIAGEVSEKFGQRAYRAALNGGNGPQLAAASVTGRVYLLPMENPRSLAASVLPAVQPRPAQEEHLGRDDFTRVVTSLLIQPPTARTFLIQKARHEGNLELTVPLGSNVFYAQIDGDATVNSLGGEVVLARVGGVCTIESKGGGVNLGDVAGPVDLSTAAGDVLVRAALKGGQVNTGGGSIDVLYAGDAMTLRSGGGDLTVRQAAGGLRAMTESGDIIVTTDPKPKDLSPISLTTKGGNIVFEVSATRGFDIDAEIEADAASANLIESAFSGLTMVREKTGNRVTIRARGKVNGGGTPVTLRASDGNIIISRVPENRVFFVQ